MKYFFVALFSFVVGIVFFRFALIAAPLSNAFWDVNAGQLIQPVVTLFVGCVFAYFVPDLVGKVKRRREIQSDEINHLLIALDEVVQLGTDYFSSPSKKLEGPILASLKDLAKKIDFVKELHALDPIPCLSGKDMDLAHLEIKILLTDSPFGSTTRDFSANRVSDFSNKCAEFRRNIAKSRYMLFI